MEESKMNERKEILKPMSIEYYEFINNITNLINNSMLPIFVIKTILKDIYNDISFLSNKQYEKDLAEYNKKIKEE